MKIIELFYEALNNRGPQDKLECLDTKKNNITLWIEILWIEIIVLVGVTVEGEM